MPNDLLKLAERVEQAEGPDRELDLAIMDALFQPWSGYAGTHDANTGERVNDHGWIDGKGGRWIGAPRLTESLDAAMTLVPEGYDWLLGSTNGGLTIHAEVGGRGDEYMRFGATPALALTAACLRAKATEPQT